ncbi:MAG: glycine zipper 2TM domain-containing protein [Gammaproteobacteria bacterium]
MNIKNKFIGIITTITIATTVNTAQAKHDSYNENNFFYSTARVINVEPIVKNVQISTPKKECWEEEISRPEYTHHNNNSGNVIFGGLVGGVVGNQFGHGRGKTAATVVGSIIGAAVANDITKNNHTVTRSESVDYEHRCRVTHTSYTEERIEGYWVTYRFKGEMFTNRFDKKPGKRLKIKVQVTPEFH